MALAGSGHGMFSMQGGPLMVVFTPVGLYTGAADWEMNNVVSGLYTLIANARFQKITVGADLSVTVNIPGIFFNQLHHLLEVDPRVRRRPRRALPVCPPLDQHQTSIFAKQPRRLAQRSHGFG